jgi:Predicted glycosyl hydrolase
MRKKILLLAVALTLLLSRPVSAQTSGPVYIVQSGDTLWDIAIRFNVAMTDLMTANGLSDANLHVGQELVIPGLEGLTGVLDTEVVGFGDSLRGLARRNQTPVELLRRLNHITSPSELYVGVSLVVPKQDEGQTLTASASPAAGETLLEVAVRENSDPWTLSSLNSLNGTWDALPGDVLYSKSGDGDAKPPAGCRPLSSARSETPAVQTGRDGGDHRPARGGSDARRHARGSSAALR